MIIYPENIKDKSQHEADFCIIGSGPAGISLALELIASGKKIVMLTGGLSKETLTNRNFHKGIVDPIDSHEELTEFRRRAFGGASIAWGGRCIPYDPIDFEERSWIPFSGWPFGYDTMIPYYKRASYLCKVGTFEFDAHKVFPNAQKEIIENFDDATIHSRHLERWSPPVNFAKEYKHILEKAANISVLMDAHLKEIKTEIAKDEVSSVTAYIKNKHITIVAKNYVLATGGIENARLLLASKNKHHPQGIGNQNDVVGRYYMSHIDGVCLKLAPDNRKNLVFDFETDPSGVLVRRRWAISKEAQKENKMGNAIFFLQSSPDKFSDPLLSLTFIAKFILTLLRDKTASGIRSKWEAEKQLIQKHLKIVFTKGWKQIPKFIKIARQRTQKRKLPFILPSVNAPYLGLYFQSEQIPNPKSRITLSEKENDVLGMPRAQVSIAFEEIDKKTIIEAHKIFIKAYERNNLGKFDMTISELSTFIHNTISKFSSKSHHLGATRMSENEKLGVVDSNCKVHGMNNLYIAGSSVFPTSSHANPTFTIVALAVKLAEFLKKN